MIFESEALTFKMRFKKSSQDWSFQNFPIQIYLEKKKFIIILRVHLDLLNYLLHHPLQITYLYNL